MLELGENLVYLKVAASRGEYLRWLGLLFLFVYNLFLDDLLVGLLDDFLNNKSAGCLRYFTILVGLPQELDGGFFFVETCNFFFTGESLVLGLLLAFGRG